MANKVQRRSAAANDNLLGVSTNEDEVQASPKLKIEMVRQLALDKLCPNLYQPRRDFDDESLEELASSIKEHGIIQPLTAAKHPERPGLFYIVAGERRWRAAQRLQLASVPVIVREVGTNQEMAELALIENVQRKDLNPIEAARAYARLMEEFGLTQAQIAERTGKSQPSIAKALQALTLPTVAQAAIEAKTLPLTTGLALRDLSNAEAMTVIEQAKNGQLNREETAEIVKQLKAKKTKKSVNKRSIAANTGVLFTVNNLGEPTNTTLDYAQERLLLVAKGRAIDWEQLDNDQIRRMLAIANRRLSDRMD